MLSGDQAEAMRNYNLDDVPSVANGHRLVISTNYISLGYQAFFPGINALRFDFTSAKEGSSQWSTAALVDPKSLPNGGWDSTEVWRAMPAKPAACASLPLNWDKVTSLLSLLNSEEQTTEAVSGSFTGVGAMCWYAKSPLSSPLFIAQIAPEVQNDLKRQAKLQDALGKLFTQVIGSYEKNAKDATGYSRLPVEITKKDNGTTIWTRPVSAQAGIVVGRNAPYASELSASRYFPVTLAQTPRYIIFSPDKALVSDALAVQSKSTAALSDTVAPDRQAGAFVVASPKEFASLAEREASLALPAEQEAVFRNAARTHLFPKLHALAQYPQISLSLSSSSLPPKAGWVTVQWNTESGN
jgi:uncharacterized protein YfaA (DUF2138 family)